MGLAHERWQTGKGSEWGGHVQLCRFFTAQETPMRGSRTEIQHGLACQAVSLAWATHQVEGAPFVNLHQCAPCRAVSAQRGHLYLVFANYHKCSPWSLVSLRCLEQRALHQRYNSALLTGSWPMETPSPAPRGHPACQVMYTSLPLVTQCQSLWVISLEPRGHGHSC